MLKPSVLNIVIYFFLKYFIFYLFMMFKTDIYTLVDINSIKSGEDLFFYLWMFLSLPALCAILLSVPLYYAFKVSKVIYFLLLLSIIFALEYLLYTYMASQLDLMNGLINEVIGVLLLFLLFYKYKFIVHN